MTGFLCLCSLRADEFTVDRSLPFSAARALPPRWLSLLGSEAGSAWARRKPSLAIIMDGVIGTAPSGTMYVRALYDYEADDRTSLSFHTGDVIQVITQLESGWWDGVINDVRGWFPSNYCEVVDNPDELSDGDQIGHAGRNKDDTDDNDAFDEGLGGHEDESEADGSSDLPLEGTVTGDKSGVDFWIPQATPDGRLFYYNTMTGDRRAELPLESPVSFAETGPRDRMNVTVPDKTRPPPEMMARGLTQDEDEDSITSASEVEGDSSRLVSRVYTVRILPPRALTCGVADVALYKVSESNLVQRRAVPFHLDGLDERRLPGAP